MKGKVAGIFTSAGTSRDGKDCLKILEVALGFHHEMKVVEGILRVDGESDKEVEKRCEEYGKKILKEIIEEAKHQAGELKKEADRQAFWKPR